MVTEDEGKDGVGEERFHRLEQVRNGELRLWMLAAMGCALAPRSAVYVSTPITTGLRFVRWRRGPGAGLGAGDAEYRQGLLDAVIQPNRAQIAPLVGALRKRFDSPVIDPTELEDVPGWEQFDYHRFWAEVIERYAHTVVFADGWHYSSGCVLELTAAAETGATLLRQDLAPLEPEEAVHLVESAIADVATDGALPEEPLQKALKALRTLTRADQEAVAALHSRR